METRVALIGIIVENPDSVEKMNALLHEYGSWIMGRMGVPYREKGMSIISIVIDAPMNQISSLSGKLGMLDGVSTKTIYSRQDTPAAKTDR
ncbi:MAG TPA: iron-only hydrogenase system regulator [Candidatus Copromonas faecavium]|uniref:Iron-only hydrogenase system regulator n=1 Tax=Candidatus Copromonas faecavium (nom. illeg.) TaxID=2840740 RepID=A0A9D1D6V7_9FIRM|nr:iron-only hydrogenase system regulator [Candidatus Copromonas faecavium]